MAITHVGAQDPETIAVSSTAASFTKTMQAQKSYKLVATTDLWWQVAATPTAVVHGASSGFLKAGQAEIFVLRGSKTHVSVVRDTADGYATLCEMVSA